MERSEIAQKVEACVRDALGLADDVTLDESTTLKDLGADSFDQLEIMVALEEEFDIKLEDALDGADMSSINTIGQTVDLVQGQLS
ncbi:MAG: phosphopantetheine-binding protein [Parafannyhessea sp.]|uniref:phosphopantetheine-binding protein n=1 Tax=Parafannyhessea sp. TaxID=2847324 RepID=UPI003F0C4E2E